MYQTEQVSNETIRNTALKFSLKPSDVAGILAKWGPAVLKLVVDGLTEGFSFEFLQEVLNTIGPAFIAKAVRTKRLQAQVKYVKQADASPCCTGPACEENVDCCLGSTCEQETLAAHLGVTPAKWAATHKFGDAPIIQGQEVSSLGGNGVIANIIVQAILQLLQQQGPQLAQQLMNWLISLLQQQTNQTRLATMLSDALSK